VALNLQHAGRGDADTINRSMETERRFKDVPVRSGVRGR